MPRKATAAAGLVAVAVFLLASAAQARPPARPSARAASHIAADRGGNGQSGNGHGNQGNGNGNHGDGNGNGNGGGRDSGGGNSPGAVTASESAAAQRVLDEALAAAGKVSARLRAELAKFFGQPASPSTAPSASASSPARPAAGQKSAVVVVRANGVAAGTGPTPHPLTVSAPGTPVPRASSPSRSAASHRGLEPISLPMLASANDWAVTAVFGFFVLGLLWTAWMASLRPVLGRRAPVPAGGPADLVHTSKPPPGVPPAPSQRRRPGVHRR